MKALEKILQDATAGDPISGLKWTRKTTRKLAEELKGKEFQVGHSTIPRLVRKLKYTLRSNQKHLVNLPKLVPIESRKSQACWAANW